MKVLSGRLAAFNRIYLILDKEVFSGLSLEKKTKLFSSRSIGIIQLRDKKSSKPELLKFALEIRSRFDFSGKLFIINDYPDLAVASMADGVHLGQSDLPLRRARDLLGKEMILGISCHTLDQALKAQDDGADYLGIGPVYSTATKPGCRQIGLRELSRLKGRIRIPYFAIGGIDKENLEQVKASGGNRIAVCGAVLKAASPGEAADQLLNKLRKI
ncbi:MAG: thiamine phosphate synthase [Candidatus Omnitrophica bacterium]|nr:thiamine phosphate synthase [Candidatus Omnitrophota bacterium]MDD3274318.1 thiamine phosphate synthase [Candidatus Omnitrophota bacterium]MDD5077382.1 thiamine phosphate synthase [Candidatus Omnitrophota bacterium]